MSYSNVFVLNSMAKIYPLPKDLAEHNDFAVMSVSSREIEDSSCPNVISLPH